MAWNSEPTQNLNRSRHIPPHVRQLTANNTESTRPRSNRSSSPRRTHFTSGRGRSLGRGRGCGLRSSGVEGPPSLKPNRLDVTEKFDELEAVDGESTDKANMEAYDHVPVEVSGEDVPPPIAEFADVDLGDHLKQNMERCKFFHPTPIQRHGIPIAVAGRDLMACAQTGSGKTAAFCFPIICGVLKGPARGSGGRRKVACPLALILAPTRELSCQIHEEAKKFAYETGVKIAVAYGGAPISHQLRNMERGVDILVATPGRLVDMIERTRVSLRMVRYLALDEADRMLDMGFEPQIRKIVEQMDMPPPGARQTMLFSATFPTEIQSLVSDFLSNYVFLSVGRVGSSTDLIVQRVELVQDIDKRNHLLDILCAQRSDGTLTKDALTLVFVETKRGADSLESWLFRSGFQATAIHGDKGQMERERALKSFKSGATPILVATDVASRGLDIPHVAHVINFDLPRDIDGYVHRIGRTGRAGKCGLATAFFSDKNQPLAKALVELMKESKQDVPSWLSQYAENASFGGSSARIKHTGAKFGGYDMRRGAQSEYENYSYYDNAESVLDPYTAPTAIDYANSGTYMISLGADYYVGVHADPYATTSDFGGSNAEPFAVGSHDYGYGYGAIAPTGWD